MNILFVCSGNISRSFLAEALFLHELKDRPGLDVSVRSAGLRAFPGNTADTEMVCFLLEQGLSVPDHRARALSRKDVAWAERILVMEIHHLQAMEREFPESAGKTELLGRYIAGAPEEIEDPFGCSSHFYRLAQSRIGSAVKGLLRELERTAGKDSPC